MESHQSPPVQPAVGLPPETLRIKRKRTENPVNTLYFDDTRQRKASAKKIKINNFVFRLGETTDEPPPSSNIILQSTAVPSSHRRNSSESRVFRMLRAPKSQIALRQKHLKEQQEQQEKVQPVVPADTSKNEPEDSAMSDMLSSMVDSYLRVSGEQIKEPTRKRRHLTLPGQVPQNIQVGESSSNKEEARDEMEVDDYVYDIYYRESQQPQQHERTGLVGLILFDSEDEKLLGIIDDEDESDFIDTGDEDSNAEDFYKNDYPDEEDEGSLHSEEYLADYSSRGSVHHPSESLITHRPRNEFAEGREYLNYRGEDDDDDGSMLADEENENEEEDEYNEADYDDAFRLHSKMNTTYGDSDDQFSGDEENMEHYRDRIFGDLQKQIEERKKLQKN